MLYLVSTPIGNLEDITLRALRVLREVDFILAEDTRATKFMLKHFGIEQRIESFYDHNEDAKIPKVLRELKKGKDIALVSTAGTPTISDPGYRLVRALKKENAPVTAIPGVSSPITAITLSAIPHDKFTFFGYFPRKESDRRKALEKISQFKMTAVFLESPYRIEAFTKAVKKYLPKAKLTIARELTKTFEEVVETTAEEAETLFSKKKPRGEYVVVLRPADD